jgi:hypothetical protein
MHHQAGMPGDASIRLVMGCRSMVNVVAVAAAWDRDGDDDSGLRDQRLSTPARRDLYL